MTSWSHTILNDTGRLVLVTSRDAEGRSAFYFLLLAGTQRTALATALQGSAPIDLAQFGRIVHSGWGDVSEADRRRAEECIVN